MSTAAAIGKEEPDGSVRVIYLSQDGDPSWAGYLLQTAWTAPECVQALLDLGDLKNLGEEVGERHDMEAVPHPAGTERWCRAYMRDRGDHDRSSQTFRHIEALLQQCNLDETPWVYLYREERWEVYTQTWVHTRLDQWYAASHRR